MIGYLALLRFGPDQGDAWRRYIEWSGLIHLVEAVTLDGILCPNVIERLTPEDWRHNLADARMLFGFRNLGYLLGRIDSQSNRHVLAVIPNPGATDRVDDDRFEFVGYDLIDVAGDVSALTNCGGLPGAFAASDLNEYGLISDYDRAIEIQRRLRHFYPEEHHADCGVWAIWRMISEADE